MAKKKPRTQGPRTTTIIDRLTTFDPVIVDTCLPEMQTDARLQRGPLLGKGGMATVSAAIDTNLNRMVALKTTTSDGGDDESRSGRLIMEAQITAQLDHPNIVPVYELGADEDGRVFFTMKLINGRTLTEVLDEKPPNTRTEKDLFDGIQIFLKVLDAVAFAHAKGVIHKDLKPDNVMIGEYGEVYLMDWGFARLVGRSTVEMVATPSKTQHRRQLRVSPQDGLVAATPHYLAPELTTGGDFKGDDRTDIFCLGGILYRILTGKPPFHGETMAEVAQKALISEVPPPEEAVVTEVPPRLSRIAMKALAKDPGDRYQSVADMKDDIERFLQSGWQFERRRFGRGQLIVREGDVGTEAYIITSGNCVVYKTEGGREIRLQELGVGDVFGELSVFAGHPRAATVAAVDDVTVMVLEKHHFEADLGMSFWLGIVVKSLADRFVEVSNALLQLKQKNP